MHVPRRPHYSHAQTRLRSPGADTVPNREQPSSTEAMSSLALVIVADVIAFVLIAAGLASRIPDFTVAGSVLGFLAFAVSLRWLWNPD